VSRDSGSNRKLKIQLSPDLGKHGANKQRQLLQVRKPHVVMPSRSTRGTVQFSGSAALAQLETRWVQHNRIVIAFNQPILYKHQSILSVPVVWSQTYNTVIPIALVNLLRQPVDEDEKRADRCNKRKNDSVHGFLPSDRREDVVNL